MLQTKLGSRKRKQRRKSGPFNNIEILTVDDVVQCLNNLNKSSYVKKICTKVFRIFQRFF